MLWVSAAALAAASLAGCTPDGQPDLNAAAPRGATVAFDSIDGLPPGQFNKLVADLNAEAQSRRLAVASRESASAYRVRGYLAAKVSKGETTVSWVWDVFDRDEHRALRITGEDKSKGRRHDAWTAADDAMLRHIASSSMDQLAAFLTSPDVAPSAPAAAPQLALTGGSDSSPEAAGIFRIFQPQPEQVHAAVQDSAVPLPRPRPVAASPGLAVSQAKTPAKTPTKTLSNTLTLAAVRN